MTTNHTIEELAKRYGLTFEDAHILADFLNLNGEGFGYGTIL